MNDRFNAWWIKYPMYEANPVGSLVKLGEDSFDAGEKSGANAVRSEVWDALDGWMENPREAVVRVLALILIDNRPPTPAEIERGKQIARELGMIDIRAIEEKSGDVARQK